MLYNNSPIEFAAYSAKAANGTWFYSDDEGKVEILYPSSSSTDTDTINIYPVVGYTCDSTVTASMATDNTVDLTASVKSFDGTVTTSATLYITSSVYPNGIQIWGCGGGGSGGAVGSTYDSEEGKFRYGISTGGAGGYTTNVSSIEDTALPIVLSITVGSGGDSVQGAWTAANGKAGGGTSIANAVTGLSYASANGGSGGLTATSSLSDGASYTLNCNGSAGGSGSGGSYVKKTYGSSDVVGAGAGGSDGSSGITSGGSGGTGQGSTTRSFCESTGTLYCSGGGSSSCGCYYRDVSTSSSGGPGGGSGASGKDSSIHSGGSGTTYGSGGGASGGYYSQYAYGLDIVSGSGYQGVVMIRGIS